MSPAWIFGCLERSTTKRPATSIHPEYAVRQALLVDTKAEKDHTTATLQTAQTSLRILHVRTGVPVDVQGELPTIIESDKGNCLTTTIFIKYEYQDTPTPHLVGITVAALPSGMLQDRYNPSATDTIWRAGRNAPTLGEPFRVRLVFGLLKAKASWRVQQIPLTGPFVWDN